MLAARYCPGAIGPGDGCGMVDGIVIDVPMRVRCSRWEGERVAGRVRTERLEMKPDRWHTAPGDL
jgi:hypothetical protein